METSTYLNGTIERLKAFSSTAEDILIETERHEREYRNGGLSPLRERLDNLNRYIKEIPGREDNIPSEERFDNRHLRMLVQNITVSRDKLAASRFMHVPIEPIRDLAQILKDLGLATEAARLLNVHDFCLGMRRWYRAMYFGGNPEYELARIRFTTIREDLEMPVTKGAYIDSDLYTCTDPDNRQYARRVTDRMWHYTEYGSDETRTREGLPPFPDEAPDDLFDITPVKDLVIDLRDHSLKEIDDALAQFGYTRKKDPSRPFVLTDCTGNEYSRDDSIQLICEALFETD